MAKDWISFHCETKRETAKAVLVNIAGQEHWIPKSQLDEWPDEGWEGPIYISPWWASKIR